MEASFQEKHVINHPHDKTGLESFLDLIFKERPQAPEEIQKSQLEKTVKMKDLS